MHLPFFFFFWCTVYQIRDARRTTTGLDGRTGRDQDTRQLNHSLQRAQTAGGAEVDVGDAAVVVDVVADTSVEKAMGKRPIVAVRVTVAVAFEQKQLCSRTPDCFSSGYVHA